MAIALGNCRFAPATSAKRFARHVSAAARADGVLTDPQAALLRKLVVSYRRQIPAEVVALARKAP